MFKETHRSVFIYQQELKGYATPEKEPWQTRRGGVVHEVNVLKNGHQTVLALRKPLLLR